LPPGHQAYVVYPVIEENAETELKAAIKMYRELSGNIFSDLKVGLLHGRLDVATKEQVMRMFQKNELQILVATTVIEVGVDVPNATVMVIEHAERFGLAQLHQLRGRIGRGAAKSYCILMTGGKVTEEGERRLEAMVRNQRRISDRGARSGTARPGRILWHAPGPEWRISAWLILFATGNCWN
jgi:ATP-dependent DNA helicase RecG